MLQNMSYNNSKSPAAGQKEEILVIKYRRSVKKLIEPFRLPPEEFFERIGPIVAKTEKGGAFLLRRKKNGKFFVWYGGVMCVCDQSEAFAFAARQGKLSEKELFEGYSFFVLRDLSQIGRAHV